MGKISQLASAYNLLFVYFSPNAVKSPPEKNSWDLEIFVACGIWKNRGKNVVKKIPAAVRSKFPHSKFRWPFFVGGAAQDGSRWCSSDGADIYSWNDTPHDMRLKYVLKRHRTLHLIDCRSFLCCGWLQQTSVSFKGPRYSIAECII